MTAHANAPLPLVYACSGCSAPRSPIMLRCDPDRSGVAEMSCIAGVGGDVASLLKTARSGRPIVALYWLPAGLRKKQSGAPRHHARKALPIAAAAGVKSASMKILMQCRRPGLERVRADLLAELLAGLRKSRVQSQIKWQMTA